MPTLEGILSIEWVEDPGRPGTYLMPPRWKFIALGAPTMETEFGTQPIEAVRASLESEGWIQMCAVPDADHPGYSKYSFQKNIVEVLATGSTS
jgi:hypothetical protein